jgi:cystathionine beta-lyase family protein involved in aluminum resistance
LKAVIAVLNAIDFIRQAEHEIHYRFLEIDEIAYSNQEKVLKAFQNSKICDYHFNGSSGYGYGDLGRDTLEKVYAEVFDTEDAMVRSQVVSGTHAISACLFGVLRPGDELISVIGSPYDTLGNVIGKGNSLVKGTLIERGVVYKETPLTATGNPDLDGILRDVTSRTKMVLIQRSRGYSLRPALRIEQIKDIIKTVRKVNPQTIIMIDNCYGEFTDTVEPTISGSDLMAGSLIKNPGGGLAPSGGYIVGKKDLVEQVAFHLTAPGLGKELGASLHNNRLLYQGLFVSPHVVGQAMKSACLMAYCFQKSGYRVFPEWDETRGDIVQVIELNSAQEVLEFCQVVQSSSPVDSNAQLEFAGMPGYTDRIVMAAGTFVQGSSIEMSCDAPLREPYCVYIQGGLTYEHCRLVLKNLINRLILKK